VGAPPVAHAPGAGHGASDVACAWFHPEPQLGGWSTHSHLYVRHAEYPRDYAPDTPSYSARGLP
jgi:hypothetical protein